MVLSAILVTLYWLSFPYVGLHVLALLEKRWKEKPLSSDPLTRLFLGLCFGFATFLPIALAGYLLSAPIEPVSLLWVFIVLVFLTKFRNSAELIKITKELLAHKYLWILGAVIAADYAMSIYAGGYFSGDAWGHMARITDILNNGFTIFDPYFPNLIDLRASVSFTHALYASGASIVGVDSTMIWLLSLAFFRLSISLSVYAVMRLITKSNFVSSITAVVSIVAFSYDWRFIQYPNKLARLWLIFIALGCIEILKNPKSKIAKVILISGSVLSTLTHPVYSAGISGFILVTILIHWLLTGRTFSKAYVWLLASTPILVFSTAAGALLPARSSFGSGLEGELSSFAGMTIMNPGYVYSITYITISVGFLAYIFKTSRSTALRSTALAAVVTFPLIVFTPLFDLAREYLTPRIIFRYRSGTNFLGYNLTKVAAIILLSHLLFSRLFNNSKIVVQTLVIIVAASTAFFYQGKVMQFVSSQRSKRDSGLARISLIKNAVGSTNMSKDVLLVSDLDSSYISGSFANVSVVAIPDGHAPRSYNRSVRKECLKELLSEDSYLRQNAIRTLRPGYYLSNKGITPQISEFQELELVSEANLMNNRYTLYKVNYGELTQGFGFSASCKLINDGEA